MVGSVLVILSVVSQLSDPGNRVRCDLVSHATDGYLTLSLSSDRSGGSGDPCDIRQLPALGTDYLRALLDRYCVGGNGVLFPRFAGRSGSPAVDSHRANWRRHD